MYIFDKLASVNIEHKENSVTVGEEEKEDYILVIEENRVHSYFVHIVPQQIYGLFKEMQQKAPNELLGFSVLAGKHNDKEIRVSCFGVPCNLLGKALFERKKRD